MPVEFTDLWVATSTADESFSGTDDPIVVIVNQDGVDKVHRTVADALETRLWDQVSNIFPINVEGSGLESTIDPADDTYFRIAIRGPNAWVPEHVFIWGVDPGDVEPHIVPLAARFDFFTQISADQSEGPVSFPVPRVPVGDVFTQIDRLILLVETSTIVEDAGTSDRLRLRIETQAGDVVVNHTTRDTPDVDLEPFAANFYMFTPSDVFSVSELHEHSITLCITGKDAWVPSRLFLFGLEMAASNIEAVVPLVHVEDWANSSLTPILSTDLEDLGEECVTLPLVI